jgi:hypothetical protein
VCWRPTEAEMIEKGKCMLRKARQMHPSLRYEPASIMARRHEWPAPPILWLRREPIAGEPWDDIPVGLNLVEGHRKVEMAKALAADGLLKPDLPAWIIRY